MKKKVLGVILTIAGLLGFLLLLGGTGGMETGSASFIVGTYIILAGCLILVLVIFVGIPYYDNLDFRELPSLPKWQRNKKKRFDLI